MDKIQQLRGLLGHKKSKAHYAQILGVSVNEVEGMLSTIRNSGERVVLRNAEEVEGKQNSYKHNHTTDTIEVTGKWKEIPTPEAIIKRYKIDLTKYRLSNTWIKDTSDGHLVSVSFLPLSKKEDFSEKFVDFLKGYKTDNIPSSPLAIRKDKNNCLIFNMQDAHYNKLDVDGDNNMDGRFYLIKGKANRILQKAAVSGNLAKIIYIIGADHFNSEWTDCTTKGTPQSNLTDYQDAFKRVCEHEIDMIKLLSSYTNNLQVVFCGGNHDQWVSWHMVNWLEMYFSNEPRISFVSNGEFTKYIRYNNSAFCINHGDTQKPERLAQNFPIEFKDQWSLCDFFFIFTGDRHTDLSKSIGGIEFHQIPALSKAKSNWDKKNGYTTAPTRLSAYLIDETNGMTDLYKENI